MFKFGKKYLFLMAFYFCLQLAVACYGPYINVFFKEQGMSTSVVGLVASIAPLAAIFIQPLWANLADKTGKMYSVLVLLLAASSISMLLYYAVDFKVGYILVNILYSVFFTGIPALQDTYVLGIIQKDGHSYSTIRMSATVGYALGVILFGKVFDLHLSWIFAFGSLFLAVTLTVFLIGVPKVETHIKHSSQNTKQSSFFEHKFAVMILVLLMGVYMSVSFISSFIGIFVGEMGYATTYISVCIFISTFSEVPVLLMINKLIDRFGEVKLLILSGILMMVRMVLTSTGILWIIMLMQAMQGLTYMINVYCGTTLIFRIMPDHLKSKGQSMMFLVQSGIGSIIGTALGGFVADKIGFSKTFVVIGVVTFILTLFVLVYYMKNKAQIDKDTAS